MNNNYWFAYAFGTYYGEGAHGSTKEEAVDRLLEKYEMSGYEGDILVVAQEYDPQGNKIGHSVFVGEY